MVAKWSQRSRFRRFAVVGLFRLFHRPGLGGNPELRRVPLPADRLFRSSPPIINRAIGNPQPRQRHRPPSLNKCLPLHAGDNIQQYAPSAIQLLTLCAQRIQSGHHEHRPHPTNHYRQAGCPQHENFREVSQRKPGVARSMPFKFSGARCFEDAQKGHS